MGFWTDFPFFLYLTARSLSLDMRADLQCADGGDVLALPRQSTAAACGFCGLWNFCAALWAGIRLEHGKAGAICPNFIAVDRASSAYGITPALSGIKYRPAGLVPAACESPRGTRHDAWVTLLWASLDSSRHALGQ